MCTIASFIIGGMLSTGGLGNLFSTPFGVLTLKTINAIVLALKLRDPW